MKLTLIILAACAGVALICTCAVFSSKNTAVSLEETVNMAKAGIDVQLSNRFNKLTEIAECVKQYDGHEYKTLTDTIKARGKNMSAGEFKATMASIKAYNESVRDYRYHCRKFPTSIFLGWTGYEVQTFEMYAADESVKDSKPMKLF